MALLMADPLDRPATLFGDGEAGGDLGGEHTLDETIAGAWEGLAAQVAVACPLCGGAMLPAAGEDGGRCKDCGTTLA